MGKETKSVEDWREDAIDTEVADQIEQDNPHNYIDPEEEGQEQEEDVLSDGEEGTVTFWISSLYRIFCS